MHPPIFFNNKPVQQVSLGKHLRLILDTSLTFDEHNKAISSKVSRRLLNFRRSAAKIE